MIDTVATSNNDAVTFLLSGRITDAIMVWAQTLKAIGRDGEVPPVLMNTCKPRRRRVGYNWVDLSSTYATPAATATATRQSPPSQSTTKKSKETYQNSISFLFLHAIRIVDDSFCNDDLPMDEFDYDECECDCDFDYDDENDDDLCCCSSSSTDKSMMIGNDDFEPSIALSKLRSALRYNLALACHIYGSYQGEAGNTHLKRSHDLYVQVLNQHEVDPFASQDLDSILYMALCNNVGCIYRDFAMHDESVACLGKVRDVLSISAACRQNNLKLTTKREERIEAAFSLNVLVLGRPAPAGAA